VADIDGLAVWVRLRLQSLIVQDVAALLAGRVPPAFGAFQGPPPAALETLARLDRSMPATANLLLAPPVRPRAGLLAAGPLRL
jgi:hypothetical protein